MALRPQLKLLSDGAAGTDRRAKPGISSANWGPRCRTRACSSYWPRTAPRSILKKARPGSPGPAGPRRWRSVPRSFKLFDVMGNETHDFSGSKVHFTPGSAALHVLDYQTQQIRKPDTADYVRYAQLLSGLAHIASQSTAFIPADVADRVSDSYRLFLSLLYGEKPVVTGTFTIESFQVMKDMQLAVRGGEKELRDKPLTIFSCCPTSPLKWSEITSQNVVDCGAAGIPVEFISMPLSGFMAPVTLVGTLVQHTAETLSGIVISQASRPGTPVLYGGSPAVFDMRYETTPMGAVETQMVDCAYNEIGKHSRPAHPGLYLLERRQAARRPGRAGNRHGRHPGRPFRDQQHFRARHARFRELPEPGKTGPGQRDLRHDPAPGAGHRAPRGFPGPADFRGIAARRAPADLRRTPAAI